MQGDADIPEDPQVAFKSNALKVTRIDAVAQVKSMVALVDDIAATALQSMVSRPQRSIETIASFDQWSGTIENH